MTRLARRDGLPPPEPRIRTYTYLDNPNPESPAGLCFRLGLAVDLSRYGSPEIIGPTGKRHSYPHGAGANSWRFRPEAMDILRRLARRRAAIAKATSQ